MMPVSCFSLFGFPFDFLNVDADAITNI